MLGNVRSHIKFWPRWSTLFTELSTKWGRDNKITYQHIVQLLNNISTYSLSTDETCDYQNITTGKDGDKNKKKYEYWLRPKHVVQFLKTVNNQIKMPSDKIYTKKDYLLLH